MAKVSETNVDIAEVKSVLGHNSNDLGTLCKSDRINMWSRKKPIHNRKGDLDALDWYESSTGNYGFSIPQFTVANDQNWSYNPPIGGEASPYCLGDFRGYDTAHTPVIALEKDSTVTSINVNKTPSLAFLFHFNFSSSNGVTPTELGFGNYYLGARVVGKNGVSKEFTSENTIANNADFMAIDFNKSPFDSSNFVGQTVKIQPFICSDKQSDPSAPAQSLGDQKGLPFGIFNGIEYVNEFDVKIEKKATFSVVFTHVNDENSTVGWITPESTLFMDEGDPTNYSKALITGGALALKFKAIGDTTISSNLELIVQPTYFGSTFKVDPTYSLYKNGVKTNHIIATPAGNEYVIYFSHCLNDDNGHASYVTNKATESFVQLKQNGITAGATSFTAATSTYISGGGGMDEL
ncbi:hypothetical protein [Marinifilum flexuosum]|uniref:hypothetical protein n=1 Tax=Marinifilum flexuosum TaxID=1117708 RepID=UPI002493D613|nr:hypothetical protein [Marinifilum flexuosum]